MLNLKANVQCENNCKLSICSFVKVKLNAKQILNAKANMEHGDNDDEDDDCETEI